MVESSYLNRPLEESMGRLAPTVRPFVEALFTSELFPIHDLDLVTPLSGLLSSDSGCGEGVCDRFKLVLPYAGFSVVWEVIFDGSDPDAPPDFIFDDESFLCECELDEILSLTEWDAKEKNSLVFVITELLNLYCKHQYRGVERCVGPTIGRWLDPGNTESHGMKIEILNNSLKTSPYSTLSRQATKHLQQGATSVLVVVPFLSELVDTKNMKFSVHYIFKSHNTMFEEKTMVSPELDGWLQPYVDVLKKRNRWIMDTEALSAAVESHYKDIVEVFNRSVREYKTRQEILLGLHHHITSERDLKPILLELDLNEFQFSSYVFQQRRLFSVNLKGYPRSRLFAIFPDGNHRLLTEVSGEKLTGPSFDITELLESFD